MARDPDGGVFEAQTMSSQPTGLQHSAIVDSPCAGTQRLLAPEVDVPNLGRGSVLQKGAMDAEISLTSKHANRNCAGMLI